jgi:hypothetical protein
MAQTIQIKRSDSTSAPSSLSAGELAYSSASGKLYIGSPATGNAVLTIAGTEYTDLFPTTAGTLQASKLVIVDGTKKINEWLVSDITIAAGTNTDTIATTSGDLVLAPDADLDINAGTIKLDTQATEFKLIDNSATAGTFATADHTYLTFDSTNSAELVKFGRQVEFSGAYTLPTTDGTTSGQALITNGSGTVTFQDVAATLTVDVVDSTSSINKSENVALLTDDLRYIAGEGISLDLSKSGTDVAVTIEGELASASNKGVASFSPSYFTVTSGDVAIDNATASTKGIASFSPSYFTLSSGDVSIDDATASAKGIASFSSSDFSVTNGAVSIKTDGVSNDQILNPSITIGNSTIALGGTDTTLGGLTELQVDNININGNEISSTTGDISLNPNGSSAIDANSSVIKNVATPTASHHAANKGYVDGIKQALDIKDSVRAATIENITISSALNNGSTLDGVTLADGDRVLVKNQSTASENGIYVVAATPARSEDANTSAEVTAGMFCFVEEGTVNGDNGFVLTTNDTITLDTTSLTFVQFSGAGQITAGDALSKSGNTLHVNDDNITLQVSNDNLRIKGITATAAGDLLIGAATNGGYTRLVKPSSDTALLTMGTGGTASWTTTLDGGTF